MKKLLFAVVAATVAVISCPKSTFADVDVVGLYQAIYSGANITTGDPAVDGVVVPEGAILSTAGAGNPSISVTDARGGTHTLGANQTVAYKGFMKLTADTKYTFVKNFDDNGHVKITTPDGLTTKEIINSSSYSEDKYGTYEPEVTGWYAVEFRLGNGTGGVGPTKAPFTTEPCASLLWNDTGLDKCTAENRASWHRLVNDDTEGTYLFTRIPSREVSAVYRVDEGKNLTAELTIEDGLPGELFVCYGLRDRGDATNGWDYVVRLGELAEGVTQVTPEPIAGVGTVFNYARYATYNKESNVFSFSNPYEVPSKPLSPEDCACTVVFTATKVAEGVTLADYPLLVRLNELVAGFRYKNFFRQDHRDMLFLDADGTILPYDVDEWNPEGESLVWVRVPVLTKGTQVTLKYGSVDFAQNDSTAVWEGYAGVWHLGEKAAGPAYDSGANALTGMPSVAQTCDFSGAVGRARVNTASTSKKNGLTMADFPGTLPDASVFTVSGWFKCSAVSGYNRLFANKPAYNGSTGFEVYLNNASTAQLLVLGSSAAAVYPNVPDLLSQWVYLTLSYSGTTVKTYANGVLVQTATVAAVKPNDLAFTLGNEPAMNQNPWTGSYDEVRILTNAIDAVRNEYDYKVMTDASFLAAEVPGAPDPVLANGSFGLDGNTLCAQVDVYRAGLGGAVGTTVEIEMGTSPDDMTSVYAFDPVTTSGVTLRRDIPDLEYGTTYYCRFRAWCDNGTRYETFTTTQAVTTPDVMTWNGTGTDWNAAASWDGGTYPNELLKAQFPSAGGRVEATADGVAKELKFLTATPIAMAFGDHALTVGKTELGNTKKTLLTLESGDFNLGAISYWNSSVYDNRMTVGQDASLTLSGAVSIPTHRNHWVVDGGELVTTGTFSLSSRGDNSQEGSNLTLQNGASWQAAAVRCGCWYNSTIFVLSGSTLTAGAITVSNDGDSGKGNALVVSNATVSAASIAVGSDDRHQDSFFGLYQDEDETATVTLTGDFTLASQGNNCRNGKNHRANIFGGSLNVGGSLRISSDPNSPVTPQANVMTLARSTARVAVTKGCKFQRDAKLKFIVPAEGFDATSVMTAGTTMAFSSDSTVEIDATAVRQSMKVRLLTAGTSLSGLTAEQVTVAARPNVKSTVTIDDTSLTVALSAPGLSIIVR